MQQSSSPPHRGKPQAPAVVADAATAGALSQSSLASTACAIRQRMQRSCACFPGNQPPFNPSRLHWSQRMMQGRGVALVAAGDPGGPPPPRFGGIMAAHTHDAVLTLLHYI